MRRLYAVQAGEMSLYQGGDCWQVKREGAILRRYSHRDVVMEKQRSMIIPDFSDLNTFMKNGSIP